jgi:hypothetical protein
MGIAARQSLPGGLMIRTADFSYRYDGSCFREGQWLIRVCAYDSAWIGRISGALHYLSALNF